MAAEALLPPRRVLLLALVLASSAALAGALTTSLLLRGAAPVAPPPLLLTQPGEARVLEVPGAPPLGLQPRLKLPEVTVELPARAALVAVSRGVPETALRGVPLGLDGLATLLAGSPGLDPEALLAHLLDALGGPEAARPGDASLLVARLHA
jgi:hypothetical protein